MESNHRRRKTFGFLRSSILLSIAALAFGQRASADDGRLAKAAALLAADLKPHVITLDRDLKVYHYFQSGISNTDLPLSSPKFDHVLNGAINYFWSDSGHEALYAADDPAATRNYGSVLVEITIQKGSHVLTGHEGVIQISAETETAMKEIGAYDSFAPGVRFDIRLMSMARPLLAAALNSLDVEVATYEFDFANASFCASQSPTAFLILGTPVNLALAASAGGVISKHMTAIGFTPGAVDFSDPAKHDAYAKIERFLKAASPGSPLNPVSSNFDSVAMSETEKSAWLNEIYTCEGRHPSDEPAK